jgi:hypothetical protein
VSYFVIANMTFLIDGFMSRRVRGDKDWRHRNLETQMGKGGAEGGTRSCHICSFGPSRCGSRFCIFIKTCIKQILGPFDKGPLMWKIRKTRFSTLLSYNPNKRDLIGKSPKSF